MTISDNLITFSKSRNILKKDLTLTGEWQQFEINLTGKNLTRIKSALYFTTSSDGKPQTFFLDGVIIQ